MGFKLTVETDNTAGIPSKGIHRAKCVKAEQREVKNGPNQGAPMIYLQFEILTAGDKGKRVNHNITILPQTAWKYSREFAAFGIDISKKKTPVTEKSFEGKTVRVQISEDEYQGEPRARVDRILPDGKSAPATKKADDTKEDASEETPAEEPEATGSGDEDKAEDDLPF